ncbi:hypothetical protein ACSBR2_032331 [Camellia fascicularis]
MAGLQLPALVLGFSVMFMLISPSHSLTCTSQNFTNGKLYTNCTDLPSLSAYLHWTYNATNSSLSIAFIARPAKSDGWIAWALNPTGTGMAGAQALVAFKQSNGSMSVNTYNISSYSSIVKSKIAFEVPEKSAEYSNGTMKIFATLTLPANSSSMNQVWQVGGSVTNGVPDKHEFQPANLNAKATLDLVKATSQSNGTTPAGTTSRTESPAPSPTSGTTTPGGSGGSSNADSGAISMIGNRNFVLFVMCLVASFVLGF